MGMDNPSLATTAPDPVMLNLAVIAIAAGGFVIDQIMPVVNINRDSFKYPIYGADHLVDDTAIERAIGDPANAVKLSRTYGDGVTKRKSLKMDLPREIVNQSANPSSVEAQRVNVVTTRIKIGLEKNLKAALVALTGQATPSTKWHAASGVTIKKNIDAAKKLFRAQCGVDPNVILIPRDVATVMSNDSDVLARDKRVTDQQLQSGDLPPYLFGMRVVIAGVMAKDTQAATAAEIWNTDDVWLLYVDPSVSANGGDVMTFGAQFRAPAATGAPLAAAKWADPDLSANKDWYFVEVNQDEHVISSACGLRISDVLT